ncbi:hypothetical protein [Pinirhizobacter soli]|uniref:hypothetical protein n=1 Tax=Pinirhizobacter soli TaxID=2786953 RepID=UPI00202A5817|nr:hypothetical protein [Pinirhizobacter soli]
MRCPFAALGVFFFFLVTLSLRAAESPAVAGSTPLTADECSRVIRRSIYNVNFKSDDPMFLGWIKSCVAGTDHNTRRLYNCVFAATYSDSLDCAYKERGVDRSKTDPVLAARVVGDTGGFEGQVWSMTKAVYKDTDPHRVFDPYTRERYLSERDNILRSLGRTPPVDGHVPMRSQHSEVKAGGTSYWIVREDYTDLQLVKIIHDDKNGSDVVTCGRYGSRNPVDISKGYCAALLEKFLHVALIES